MKMQGCKGKTGSRQAQAIKQNKVDRAAGENTTDVIMWICALHMCLHQGGVQKLSPMSPACPYGPWRQ